MAKVFLSKIRLKNFGPIVEDEVEFQPFTYFVGRNNAGKSHYLRALDILLARKALPAGEVPPLQHDKSRPIEIEGWFQGVQDFTSLISASNHKQAIDAAIVDGVLRVVRVFDPNGEDSVVFGVRRTDGSIHNPAGFSGNLLKVLPDTIPILATADTVDELQNKANTALSKLKREVLTTFLSSLGTKTKTVLADLDTFLHGTGNGERSREIVEFEDRLKSEFVGEFADVTPSVEFTLPDEEVIAKEMRIFLDDGYRSEVELKGHGLQRATLLALLRVLAKHGQQYQNRPSPIFLIGELESFLHPYAQRQLAEVLLRLVEQYQIVTTTHSPFIITPAAISGYRRVRKDDTAGTKNVRVPATGIDIPLVQRHLEKRGNLEGLFADRVVVIEGRHDADCYEHLKKVLAIVPAAKVFTLFVRSDGRKQGRAARNFYRQMGFDQVFMISDLDMVFARDFADLLGDLGMDRASGTQLRAHIGWATDNDPSLSVVLEQLDARGEPAEMGVLLAQLRTHGVHVLRQGAPEHYFRNAVGQKDGWQSVASEADLLYPDELRGILGAVLS